MVGLKELVLDLLAAVVYPFVGGGTPNMYRLLEGWRE